MSWFQFFILVGVLIALGEGITRAIRNLAEELKLDFEDDLQDIVGNIQDISGNIDLIASDVGLLQKKMAPTDEQIETENILAMCAPVDRKKIPASK